VRSYYTVSVLVLSSWGEMKIRRMTSSMVVVGVVLNGCVLCVGRRGMNEFIVITARRYAIAVYGMALCLSGVLQCFDAVGWAAGRASACIKIEWWGAGMVICLEQGADLHTAQLMPLPLTVSCFSKIEIGFTFLVPAHLGSPGQRAVKWVCVCVCLSVASGCSSKTAKHRMT